MKVVFYEQKCLSLCHDVDFDSYGTISVSNTKRLTYFEDAPKVIKRKQLLKKRNQNVLSPIFERLE